MQITFFGVLAVVVFLAQFVLCIRKPKLVFRLIPAMVLLAALAVCGVVYVVDPAADGASFSAAVGAVLTGVLLLIDGAAWFAAFLIPDKK